MSRLLLLAGGYGRGEGGVFLRRHADPALYNDLEFYLVLKNARARPREARAWCAEEAHRGEAETGIEVEFKILRYPALDAPSHRCSTTICCPRTCPCSATNPLCGSCPRGLRDAARLPAHEATRLLFNRGTGLLFCAPFARGRIPIARATASSSATTRKRASRLLTRCSRSMDAIDFSCGVRQRAGERNRWSTFRRIGTQLRAWHRAAVDFKFHPRHENPGSGNADAAAGGSRRRVARFVSVAGIGPASAAVCRRGNLRVTSGPLFPDTSAWRNGLLHRPRRLRRSATPRGWRDYPRAALQRTLALLLQTQDGKRARQCCRRAARIACGFDRCSGFARLTSFGGGITFRPPCTRSVTCCGWQW